MQQEFAPGDRVMVVEGYPGVVTDEAVGIDFTHFYVMLDDGQGEGWWSENEMAHLTARLAVKAEAEALGLASETYPELEDIISKRPDLPLTVSESEYLSSLMMGRTASRKESLYLPLDLSGNKKSSAYQAGYSDGTAGVKSADRGEVAYSADYLLGWAQGLRESRAPSEAHETGDLEADDPNLPELHLDRAEFEPRAAAKSAGIMDFLRGSGEPTEDWGGAGRNWSEDWCRYRSNSHCFYPKALNRQASELMGYAVWVPEDRGHCRRTLWSEQEACELSQPGPNVPGGFTDATVPFEQGGQRDGIPGERIAAKGADAKDEAPDGWGFHYTAAWVDVQRKAREIFSSGGVRVLSVLMQPDGIRPEIFVTQVKGSTKTYQVEMDFVPGTFKIGAWTCSCPWNTYNWGRRVRPEWEGRFCSHALASMYSMQSQGMSGMPDSEDAIAPDWVPKAASLTSVMGEHMERNAALQERVARTKGTFRGKVNGRVVELDFDGGKVYYHGEEYTGEVQNPDYHPTRGLVASRGVVAVTELDEGDWLFHGDSTAILKDEPEPALPYTEGEDETPAPRPEQTNDIEDELAFLPQVDSGERVEDDEVRQGSMSTTAAAFSQAEQDMLIGEGEGRQARNLSKLRLEGTHYLALEPLLDEPGLDDDTISW